MPRYIVKAAYIYPVTAANAQDAFSTVPVVLKARMPVVITEGSIEITDSATGVLVLKAQFNPEKGGLRVKT